LKNRSTASEEPFTEVVSKAKKKKMHKGFEVYNTCSYQFLWFVFVVLFFVFVLFFLA